jgi:hypothetical protein
MTARLHEVRHVRMMAEARRIGYRRYALEYPAIPRPSITHADGFRHQIECFILK